MFKKIKISIFAVFSIIFLIETFSITYLTYSDINTNGLTFRETLGKRKVELSRSLYSPLFRLNKPVDIMYGNFDPITQQEIKANSNIGSLKVGKFGIVLNDDDQKLDKNFPEKKVNTIRVILLGGSSAIGIGADKTNNTISARLEHHLNRLKPDEFKYTYEVLNLSQIGGYSGNNLVKLSQYYIYFKPDKLVFLNGYNDFLSSLKKDGKYINKYINWGPDSLNNLRINKAKHYIKNKNVFIPFLPYYSFLNIYRNDQKNKEALENKIYEDFNKHSPIPNTISQFVNRNENIGNKAFKMNMKFISSIACSHNIETWQFLQPINNNKEINDIEYTTNYLNFINLFLKEFKTIQACSDIYFTKDLTNSLNNQDNKTLFIDKTHFTNLGQDEIAKIIAIKMIEAI